MPTSLYALRSTATPGEFLILKLDLDLNPEATYALTERECSCPAGAKPTCKHRKMLPMFLTKGHLNDGWFLDWHTRLWRTPIGEAGPIADQTMLGKAEPTRAPLLGQPTSPPSEAPPATEARSVVPSSAGGEQPMKRRRVV